MNPGTIAVLTVILFTIALAVSRLPRRPRRWVLLLLGLPGAILLYRWAAYRGAWGDLAIATAGTLVLLLAWWRLIGRRLPAPSDGEIRVWTKEDPF